MEVTFLQENLAKQVNFTSKALPTKEGSLSILENFLLKVKENTIEISASDLEKTIVSNIPGKIITKGEAIIPAKTLLAVLPSFTGGKINLEKKDNTLKIKGKNSTITLKTRPAGEFPKIKLAKKEKINIFSQELIGEINNLVCFAASKDETRAVLTGVLFEVEDQNLNIVATDGFRLSFLKKKVEVKTQLKKIILPAEIISILTQAVEDREEKIPVYLCQDEKQIAFYFSQAKVFTRLIEGEFPDYQKIIPNSQTTKTIIDREEFLRAIKLSSVFARDSANIVKLKIKKEKLLISANSPQTGGNESEIQAKTDGEDVEIAFNFRFLLDFLKSRSENEVIMELTGSLNPGVFRFSDLTNFFHLIMPVRLQES